MTTVVIFPRRSDQNLFDNDASLVGATGATVRGWTDFTQAVNPTTLPLTNLQNDDIADVCRWKKTDRSKTWFYTTGLSSSADGIAIVNHNMPAGAKWRVTVEEASSEFIPIQRLAPNGVTDVDGNYTTPATSEVDEDPDDDSDTAGHTVTSAAADTEARYDFATPAAAPKVGADLQEFRVKCGLTGGTGPITVTVSLYESGVLVSSLGTFQVTTQTSAGGDVASFYWNASSLGTSDGSNVQCQVAATSDATNVATVMAVAWYADTSNATQYYDSGWLACFPTGYDPDDFGLPSTVMHNFTTSQDLSTRNLFVQLWADAGGNTATTVSLGRVMVGRDIVPSTYVNGVSLEEPYSLNDDSEIFRTRDGQTRAIQRARYIVQDVELPAMTRSEKNDFLADMAAIGHGGELCLFVSSDIDIGFYENLYGRFEDWTTTPLAPELWVVKFTMEQRVSFFFDAGLLISVDGTGAISLSRVGQADVNGHAPEVIVEDLVGTGNVGYQGYAVSASTTVPSLLLENGDFVLQEDDSYIYLE